jgi:RNA 2',3'-cyclic 3'-phosphodiesterase
MAKRVFVAILLSSELQQQATHFAEAHELPVRWINSKNLHITLVPPWQEDDIEEAKRKLHRLTFSPIPITLDTVTYGPPSSPRLIWAIGEASEELRTLQETVAKMFKASPQFLLHLTLARFKPSTYKSLPHLREHINWRMRAQSVALIESRLLPHGAEYTILDEVHQ